jgi:hypothetical protein
MVRKRQCLDCWHRFPQPVGPWVDPFICPNCQSGESVGVPDADAEMEFERALAAAANEQLTDPMWGLRP